MRRFPTVEIAGLILILILFAVGQSPVSAQFRDLADRLPNTANAMVVIDVQKILQSPKAVREGWKEKVEQAFESGVGRIPPRAQRYILAAQIDFEFMKSTWEAAVAELREPVSMEDVSQKYLGKPDKIGNVPALVLPHDVYLLGFGPKLVGAMSPANRQQVVRWVRQMTDPTAKPLSPYLKKGAGYTDDVGTEIIMVLDLDGVFPPERVATYLANRKELDKFQVDRAKLAELLGSIQGVRVGVRIGDQPRGRLTVDFGQDASATAPYAKTLILETLANAGMKIDDFDAWEPDVRGKMVSLQGSLSAAGLRQLMSIIEPPLPPESAAARRQLAKGEIEVESPGQLAANKGQSTLRYFKSVETLLKDLKGSMRNMKTIGQHAVWFDKYARKIETLPMLNVDPELLDFGQFVTKTLRNGALDVRNLCIDAGVAKGQVQQGMVNPYYYGGYGYDRGGAYGGNGWYGPGVTAVNYLDAELQQQAAQRRAIRTQTRGDSYASMYAMRDQIVQTASGIRRKMTEKYQIEF